MARGLPQNEPVPRPWKLLVVAPGDQVLQTMRATITEYASGLGFETHMWDLEYEVDPTVGTDGACVAALQQHQVVVALLNSSPGSSIRADDSRFVPGHVAADLRSADVLPPADSAASAPTVLHVEVLGAKAFGKPTIVLVERDTLERLKRAVQILRDSPEALTHRHNLDPRPLLEAADWRRLWLEFESTEVFEGLAFRHAVFLQRVLNEGPNNWVEEMDLRRPHQACQRLESHLVQAPLALVQPGGAIRPGEVDSIERRLTFTRAPLTTESLRALQEAQRIIDPPYEVDGSSGTQPVVQLLTQQLMQGTSSVILGQPGLGKTTWSLLVADSLLRSDEAPQVLFGRWKEFRAEDGGTIETLLGHLWHKDAWPLRLPDTAWTLVVDGLDESALDEGVLTERIQNLLAEGRNTLLTTCRSSDWNRGFNVLNSSFGSIVTLQPWTEDQIREYARSLRENGREAAADYIESEASEGLEFLSYPLWLAMIAYLTQQNPTLDLQALENEVAVLEACGAAVVRDEARRHSLPLDDTEWLGRTWEQAAWLLHSTHGPLEIEPLLDRLAVPEGSAYRSAVASIFEPFAGNRVAGFFHEVFLEFWLARYIAAVVRAGEPEEIAGALAIHRSRLTNRLIRGQLASAADVETASRALRESYWSLEASDEYTKNQLLYLLGRVDASDATRSFLASVWRSQEPPFVRYSAGFAGVIAGDMEVEAEFYDALLSDETLDSINRGYHRAYHGDVPGVDERDVPFSDQVGGSAERAIRELCRRLRLNRGQHLRLRRIELLTLRRLVETHGLPDELRPEVDEAVATAGESVVRADLPPALLEAVPREIQLLRDARDSGTPG